jgi:hypothetical protein
MRAYRAEARSSLKGIIFVWDTDGCPGGASRDGVPRFHAIPIDHPDYEDHDSARERMKGGVGTIGTAGASTVSAGVSGRVNEMAARAKGTLDAN